MSLTHRCVLERTFGGPSDLSYSEQTLRQTEHYAKTDRPIRLSLFLGLAILLASVLGDSSFARAEIILSVSGPVDSGSTISRGTAVAVYFHLDQPFREVSIAVDIAKFNASGQILLTSSIGKESTFGNVLAFAAFDSSAPILPTPIFEGLYLTAGDYFLVVNQDISVNGFAVWSGSVFSTQIISTHPEVSTVPFHFFAATTSPFPAASSFNIVFGTGLHYTVEGDLIIPEPSALCLVLLGTLFIGGIHVVVRRGKSAAA
jgi:hypothetical protein